MGFAVWTGGGLAWAQGTHEYRPMGVAVVSATDLFRQRDFHPSRRIPQTAARYEGLFGSIVAVNDWLENRRQRRETQPAPVNSRR